MGRSRRVRGRRVREKEEGSDAEKLEAGMAGAYCVSAPPAGLSTKRLPCSPFAQS